MSIFWALSACVLFNSNMRSANGAHFLNINFWVVLFTAASAAAVFGNVIFPSTSMYASL